MSLKQALKKVPDTLGHKTESKTQNYIITLMKTTNQIFNINIEKKILQKERTGSYREQKIEMMQRESGMKGMDIGLG